MPRTRPPYPEEFKREAIELVRLTGKSVRQVATDLGISEASLRGWIKQAERDEGLRPDGLSTDEREELRKLRRENRTLRMEREILKKAAAAVCEAFFATLKKELIRRRSWPTRRELQSGVFDYIETFFNRQRRPSTLGYLSPHEYERIPISLDQEKGVA